MSVSEELLSAMQRLFGDGAAAGVSHSSKVREQGPRKFPRVGNRGPLRG